jgi:hypothetical protein
VLKSEAWRTHKTLGQIRTNNNFVEFLTSEVPKGCGWGDISYVEALVMKADDPEAIVLFREACIGKVGGNGSNQHVRANSDNVTISSNERGNGKAYTLRRLKSERPDLFELVVKGELTTNAAAIAAGWRKKRTQLENLQNAWEKASEEDRLAFLRWANV